MFTEYFTCRPLDHRALGLEAIDAHNRWALDLNRLAGRQRHVTIVPTWNLDHMLREAEQLAKAGAAAIWVPSTVPPGGTSPANEKLDEFWDIFERYDVPLVLHLNTDRFTEPRVVGSSSLPQATQFGVAAERLLLNDAVVLD